MAARIPDETQQAAAIMEVLVRHATVFGIAGKSKEEWASLFGVYIETLWDMPPAAIEEAFARWNRAELYPQEPGRHAFFPKPADLYQLAAPFWSKLRGAAWRARRALEKIKADPPKLTEQQRAENSEKIRALVAQPTVRFPPQPPGISLKDWIAKCRAEGLTADDPPPAPTRRAYESPQQVAARIRAAAATPVEIRKIDPAPGRQPEDDIGEIV